MQGLGAVELLVLVLTAVVLFGGPAVVAYWFGYKTGKKSGSSEETKSAESKGADAATEESEGSQE